MMSCPRCLEHRLRAPDGEHDARACKHCKGAWLPVAAARRVVEGPFGPLAAFPVVRVGNGALRCPECGEELVRRRVVGVEIDGCEAHGVWFDHSEVERIRAAAQQPRGAELAVGAAVVMATAATVLFAPSQTSAGRRDPSSDVDVAGVIDVTVTSIDVAATGVDVAATAVAGADVAVASADVAASGLEVAASAGEGVVGALEVVDVGEAAGASVEVVSGAFDVLAGLFEGLFSGL